MALRACGPDTAACFGQSKPRGERTNRMRNRSRFMTAAVLAAVAVCATARADALPPVDVFIYRATPA